MQFARGPVLRTATVDDLDGLLALASTGGAGLTNLPPDRDALARKLAASEAALADPGVREAGAAIMLVVEHAGQLAATSCLFPRIGAEWPFYSYRLTRQAHRSYAVSRLQEQVLLNLVNDFDGEAEVGGLYVAPQARGHAHGALAARARYLFIAAHRGWFRNRVIAELRGWQDARGRSPVWEAIGRHFYDMDFADADRLGALAGNQFIADLGPRYPLYCSLLPAEARAALGQPHDHGRPAYDMLVAEGFRMGDYVDIFDGGPTAYAAIDEVRTVRAARSVRVERVVARSDPAAPPRLAAAGTASGFRAARGHIDKGGAIDERFAAALGVEPGQSVIVVGA